MLSPTTFAAYAVLGAVASAAYVAKDESVAISTTTTNAFAHVISQDDSLFVTPHFAFVDIPKGGYVTISALDGSQATNYTGTRSNFYANYVTGSAAVVAYIPPPNAEDAEGRHAFLIDRVAGSLPDADPESICGVDNSQSAVCFKDKDPVKYQKAQAIARLFITSSSWCTGWLFGSEGHMITNNHCVRNAFSASAIQVEMAAACKTCRSQQEGACDGTIVATSAQLIHTNATLDYTLLKLNLNPGASLAQYGYLQAREAGAVLNEEIYIPEHPSGEPARIAAYTDDGSPGVISTMSWNSGCTKDSVGYRLDTEGGSSGSPVISASDNTVVALHNCGGCMNSGPNTVNGAVKIDKIVRQLKELNLVPKDALAGGSGPTSVKPSTTAQTTTNAPNPTSTAPPNTKKPATSTSTPTTTLTPTYAPQTSTKAPTVSPSTAAPTPSKTPKHTCKPFKPKRTPAPTSATPSTTDKTVPSQPPSPSKSCGTCVGCYFADVKWCVMTDVSKAACEGASGGQWCRL